MIHDAAAKGFGRGAADYERGRPGYPPEAVELLAHELDLRVGRDVVDLAAGTGKLTRLLVETGASVTAVEPVEAMRDVLTGALPGVEAVDGTAEAMPFDDASVDAVTVAQAFHWFDAPAALAEIARVLRPGGGFGLVWNVRDESVAWVREFGDLLVRHGGGRPYDEQDRDWGAVVAVAGRFTPLQERRFRNDQDVDVELLVTRAASTSYVSALPDDRRTAALADVRRLAATHPDLRDRDRFTFPHVTAVYWCHLR